MKKYKLIKTMPNSIKEQVNKVANTWKQLNGDKTISSSQRREKKIASFLKLAQSLGDEATREKIERIAEEFKPFQNGKSAVQALINMAFNYVDLPEELYELADEEIAGCEYRIA
jgi:hypothetical protein